MNAKSSTPASAVFCKNTRKYEAALVISSNHLEAEAVAAVDLSRLPPRPKKEKCISDSHRMPNEWTANKNEEFSDDLNQSPTSCRWAHLSPV